MFRVLNIFQLVGTFAHLLFDRNLMIRKTKQFRISIQTIFVNGKKFAMNEHMRVTFAVAKLLCDVLFNNNRKFKNKMKLENRNKYAIAV